MALAFTNDELLPKTNNSADYFIKSHFPEKNLYNNRRRMNITD